MVKTIRLQADGPKLARKERIDKTHQEIYDRGLEAFESEKHTKAQSARGAK